MKLELKHLAPYLPYQLNCMAQGEGKQSFEFQGVSDVNWIDLHEIGRTVCEQYDIEDVFPILRPLSDLGKVIQHDGVEFIPYIEYNYIREFLEELSSLDHTYIEHVQYKVIIVLLELHFDIFGLISKGLAIDINTLK
jgi:hypothetical protein